ncbi:Metallo-dependent phosphatase [Calocera viscosa TUFC12733]|uniref:Purple acid phosphatase n=1 Tax=Calocera viscosa (strain TUFC12733) TaxID=1330018 RepID=A0A167GVZ4_CALVF|nr:Metallo-dependent phosphatase [Calocera viscosa TUFC12733]
MKAFTTDVAGALAVAIVSAAPQAVDTTYPYTDPAIPVGDLGFPRLVEHPAIKPVTANPSNNINVISYSYFPDGVHVHFQTPFGIGGEPCVNWGEEPDKLWTNTKGTTPSYDRTPPCSLVSVTQCSQFFHEVSLTVRHPLLTTAKAAGDKTGFSVAVLNDMGYTNAAGTFQQLLKAVDDGVAFAWNGGDISYADDWYSGLLPCAEDWPGCYNRTNNTGQLPPGHFPPSYFLPLPEGEIPNQGGPYGGAMSTIYESNWDLWQYGNLSTPESTLTYYSCPESQRNFTAYNRRFRLPGEEVGGVGNFWYSFDLGLVHFIAFNGETDHYQSPELPFVADLTGNDTHPLENQTFPTDSGPFGQIDGSYKNNSAYQQIQWLKKDLASVDRSVTPWVFAMSHRPMYSTEVSSYQTHMRAAFEQLFITYNVDAYFSGHIHCYERLWPLGVNSTIDMSCQWPGRESDAANEAEAEISSSIASGSHSSQERM